MLGDLSISLMSEMKFSARGAVAQTTKTKFTKSYTINHTTRILMNVVLANPRGKPSANRMTLLTSDSDLLLTALTRSAHIVMYSSGQSKMQTSGRQSCEKNWMSSKPLSN